MSKIRHFENMHILLWLLKDTAWLMEWKFMGLIMIIPTVIVAIHIAVWSKIREDSDFWLQMAVVAWISANSFWMCCEFFHLLTWKYYASIFFVIGIIFVGIYYFSTIRESTTTGKNNIPN